MSGSTLASRALGRQLQKYRERAGLSEYAVARAVETSPQTYGRLEDGQKHNVTNLLMNAICDRLQVSNEERRELLTLAEEVRKERKSEGGWWRPHIDDIRANFEYYLQLEETARRITQLHLSLLPGLLQTPEYRRQLVWAEFPQRPPEDIERLVTLVRQRQQRLSDPRFELEAFVPEAVLRQPIGGPGVMEDQLHHLTEVIELPNVSLRVIPHDVTNPLAPIVGTFSFLSFPVLASTRLTPPPVVYIETYVGALYLEREVEVARYRDAIPAVRQVALDAGATRDLVLAIAREFSS
ncbi:helix-turn-helix domain-containing protein [Nocardia transvalensis]|uniref:helix-turn-helix domain-containing protein n=1 Tax=Nocardia transvalensis TaxID=37333 RepID=UPI001893E841|nr:helix-turn-helix transcriptional regulator [Nocardia transvalensis]MBF6329966.1 helix-turn-helix domain-containing protein [Nocardia transvalensis]